MLFTSTSTITVLLCIGCLVNGQPTLDTPTFVCCDSTLALTCRQTGFTGTGFSWKKDGTPVYNSGGDISGTGRYSQTSTANSFTLAISGAISDDGGAFVCNYAFQDSNSVTLQLYCAPTDNGVSVTRNDQKKLVIDISHIYPNTATVTVTKDTASLLGTTGTATANGDYFDIQWISNESIDDELHAYRITVVTRTTSTVIDKEVTFGGPSPGPGGGCKIIICFIGPIVTFVFALVKLIMYFTACYEILVFEDILSKKFGVRIVSPSAVMFVIGIVLAISLCLAVSECEWETGVSVVLVIICCPCGSVGIIIVHHKYIRGDNSTGPGPDEPGNSGQGQGQKPVKGDSELGRGRGDKGIHLRSEPAGGNVGRPTEGSKHQRSKESGLEQRRKLPPVPGTEDTRGQAEEFHDKNRLPPLGIEAEPKVEDTPKKKKKKKKSERKDTEDEN